MKYCPFCGDAVLTEAASFCGSCGQALPKPPPPRSSGAVPPAGMATPQHPVPSQKAAPPPGRRPSSSPRRPQQRKTQPRPIPRQLPPPRPKQSKPSRQRPSAQSELNQQAQAEKRYRRDPNYDGYYDDVKPTDSGHLREGMDPELVKRIIWIIVSAVVVIGLAVGIMLLL